MPWSAQASEPGLAGRSERWRPAGIRTTRLLPGMGTLSNLTIWGEAPAALAAAAAELERLEGLWSRFRPGSDVSRVNAAPGRWVPVAAETAALVGRAVELGELTGRAFDPTLGSTAGEPVEVRAGAVRLPPGARLDLGGIGKGAAAQRLVGLLHDRGVLAAMVNLGRSSIGLLGLPPGRDRWRVAVTRPPGPPGLRKLVLELGGGHLSTSGDYQLTSTAGNHLVDPRSGRPAGSGVRSATVLAADGVRAEAFSTALLVLGVAAGLALHARLGGFEAVMLDTAGVSHLTPGLAGPAPRATAAVPVSQPGGQGNAAGVRRPGVAGPQPKGQP